MAYRISTVPLLITNLEEKIASFWREGYGIFFSDFIVRKE